MVTSFIGVHGGALDLALGNGGKVVLTVPPDTVIDPQFVTMSRGTNITGLPFARGILAAVQIAPTNLVLFGAATIEITFPTKPPVDRRQVVSFTSHNDGTRFALALDRVGVKSAVIPLTTPGLFGSSLVSPEELDLFASPGVAAQPASATSVRLATLNVPDDDYSGFLAASRHCFIDRVLAAVAVGERLNADLAALGLRLEHSRARARQSQSADATDDPLFVDPVGLEACTFYHDRIRPLFPQVQDNCSLLRVLAGVTLGLPRQMQLLGYANCASLISLADLPVCSGAKACLDEIETCCQQDPQNRQEYRADLVAITRQQQLLGVEGQPGCFDLGNAQVQKVLRKCTDLALDGWISITESGSVSAGDARSPRFRDLSLEYYAFVIGAVGDPSGPFGLRITVTGNPASSEKSMNILLHPRTDDCGDQIGVQERSTERELSEDILLTLSGSASDASYELTIRGYRTFPPRVQISRGVQVSYSECVTENFPTRISPATGRLPLNSSDIKAFDRSESNHGFPHQDEFLGPGGAQRRDF